MFTIRASESDPAKQALINELCADYFVSSVSAVTLAGELLVCDLTGTRTGAFASTAKHLVLVVGAQKIVKDLAEARARQDEFCLAVCMCMYVCVSINLFVNQLTIETQVESARVRVAYKLPASKINNVVELRGANPVRAEVNKILESWFFFDNVFCSLWFVS